MLFEIPHNHNPKISSVLVFDVGTLVLERTALPNMAAAVDGKVIPNVIPPSFEVTPLNAPQSINCTGVVMPAFPKHCIVVNGNSVGQIVGRRLYI